MRHIIHIGGNKTASTTLQRGLFSADRRLRYLGEDCEGYRQLRSLLDSLVQDDDSHFDAAATAAAFASRFGDPTASACVYSNEDVMASRLASVCARRLRQLMPDATVVMVLRNQLTAWPSWYVNHGAYLTWVPKRYWRRPVGFDEWLEFCFEFPKRTPAEALNYFRFYRMFADLFGADRVKLFFYEELVEDARRYYARWADVLGLPVEEVFMAMSGKVERRRNSARRLRYEWIKARVTRLPGMARAEAALRSAVPLLDRWLDDGRPPSVELTEPWKQRIRTYYAPSNAQLCAVAGRELVKYGYPLPAPETVTRQAT